VNFVCQTGGINRCGQFCTDNPWLCNDATGEFFVLYFVLETRVIKIQYLPCRTSDKLDGCNTCNGNNCSSPGQQICGSPCVDMTCSTSTGCNLCQNGFCVSNRNGGGCVSTESSLRSQLEIGGTIDICTNSVIVVSTEISTRVSNIELRCASGQCSIQGGGNNRMLNFSGDNISISNLSFRDGRTTDSVSSIYRSLGNVSLVSTTFFNLLLNLITGGSSCDVGKL